MDVTHDVVTDLLPLYFSGEASEGTRRFVEDFFRQNPDFERVARAAAKPLESLRNLPPTSSEAEKEKREVQRIGWELRSRRGWLFMAVLLTLWPLTSLVSPHFASWVGGPQTWGGRSGCWGVAVYLWLLYIFRPSRRNVLLAQAAMVSVGEAVLILNWLGIIRDPAGGATNLIVISIGALAALCWWWYLRSRAIQP